MRHVAILVETARAYGRGVIRGIARYNRQSRWSIYYRPQGLGDPPPPWLRRWKGDGIIARIDNLATAQAVAEAGVPVVNLRSTLPGLPFPFIGADILQTPTPTQPDRVCGTCNDCMDYDDMRLCVRYIL